MSRWLLSAVLGGQRRAARGLLEELGRALGASGLALEASEVHQRRKMVRVEPQRRLVPRARAIGSPEPFLGQGKIELRVGIVRVPAKRGTE